MLPGVSLRSTPGYLLATLRVAMFIAAVGFDAVGGPLGDEGGADDLADDAAGAQMAAEGESGRAGLVDVADLRAVLRETTVEFVQGDGVGGNVAVGAKIPVGIGDADGDGFGMDIQADVFDGPDCG